MAKTAHEKMFSVMGNTNLKQIKIPLCFPAMSFPQLTKAQNNNSLHVLDDNNF